MRDMTSGSVWKNLLYFSLPYLLSYFLQTLYGMADLFIIGQFADAAGTTAVSVGSQVMHMVTVMIVGLAVGSTVMIGQAVGAKKQSQVSRFIGNTAVLFIGLSVVLAVILFFFADAVVAVMSVPAEAADGTAVYLRICFAGIPFITAYNVISAVFRGMGDSKSPMYFIAVACAANIVLDYVFIGGIGMGAAGAALGTVLAQTVSVITALAAIAKKGLGVSLKAEDLHPAKEVMKPILRVGIPVALQDGLIQVAFLVITVIANRRGLTDAAAVGIVEKIISFLFLVPSSMLSAVSALGAQNYGAGKQERVVQTLKYALCIAVGFGVCMAVIMQFAADPVVGLFTTDAEVVLLGGQYMRGYILDCIFAGIHFSFSGYFCACGRSELSFIHNIASIALARIPGAYIMSVLFPDTLFPMGLATACGSLVSVIICIILFTRMQRKEKRQAGRVLL